MIGFDDQKKLFDLIGKECKKKLEALIIGGSAMLFYNFSKIVTKDIDIVLLSEDDRKYLINVLENIGFKIEYSPSESNKPHKLVFEDYILDIFAKDVFKLKISDGILSRITEKIDFENFKSSVISPEDIIISKSMTDRPGDRKDAVSIIKEINVKWDAVINECIWQSKNGDFRFCIYLYDFLNDLVHDFNIKLPEDTIKKIKKLYRESLENIETKRRKI